jgi:hypothetical protein
VPRNYRPKGSKRGRKPIDDTPVARGVLFAAQIEKREIRRVVQAAAWMLMASRPQAVDTKCDVALSRDSAVRRVRETMARVNDTTPPFTTEERALLERILLMDTQVAARYVKTGNTSEARIRMRNVQAFAIVSLALRSNPDLQECAERDPSVQRTLVDEARREADAWMAREIVAI